MSNPLNNIVEIYTDAVKKADNLGLAEVYK